MLRVLATVKSQHEVLAGDAGVFEPVEGGVHRGPPLLDGVEAGGEAVAVRPEHRCRFDRRTAGVDEVAQPDDVRVPFGERDRRVDHESPVGVVVG